MRASVKVNLTEPSPRGEFVEIETQAGTIRVYGGLAEARTGRNRILIEIEQADGWAIEFHHDKIMGRAEVRQTREG